MNKLKGLKRAVRYVLETVPSARDCDFVLASNVYENFGFNLGRMTAFTLLLKMRDGTAPSLESITRIRRMLQDEFPELRGNERAEKSRRNLQRQYKSFMRGETRK